MARRHEHLCHEEAVAIVLVLHGDIVYEPRVGAPAALGKRDAVRSDAARFMAPVPRRGTDGDHAVGLGHGLPLGAARQVEAMRRCLIENVHPVAEHAPVPSSASQARLAFHHHEDHLAVACGLRDGRAHAEPPERKADIPPARRARGDLVHLPVETEGFAEKSDHCPSFRLEVGKRSRASGQNVKLSAQAGMFRKVGKAAVQSLTPARPSTDINVAVSSAINFS